MKGRGKMYCTYPAIVHEGEAGGYWAEFVDFHVFTQGDTLNDLISNAEEAMSCHLEDELRNEAVLPVPSDIRKVHTNGGAFAALVHAAVHTPLDSREFSLPQTAAAMT